MGPPVYNPGLPYICQIPGGFSPGKVLHVTGTFTPSANSFILKLQSGTSGDPNDEIGFCMYGRVAEGVIGRNAFTRQAGWGQEEATSSVAFARGQNFNVAIMCDQTNFKVAINNDHFCEYSHRINPASLTCLNLLSTPQDLHLACVWIEDGAAIQSPAGFGQAMPAGYAQQPPVGYAQAPPGMIYAPQPPPAYSQGYAPQSYQQAPPLQYGVGPTSPPF